MTFALWGLITVAGRKSVLNVLSEGKVPGPAHRGYRMWRRCSGFHQVRILCHAHHGDVA